MSDDIHIRKAGRAGRITLNRPKALNAMTYPMALAIEDALDGWADDPEVGLVVIDAEGDKAFCAGGDIVEMYETAKAGNFDYGRKFWADEYRLNAKTFNYPKPYIAFMQGFTMGGGVGISCHGSHRVVGETSQIAMPECGIGLVPDVGGTLLLSRAPGRLGEYLSTTGTRMGPGDALLAGFADHFVPEKDWPGVIAELESSGSPAAIDHAACPAPEGKLAGLQSAVDAGFNRQTAADILSALQDQQTDFAKDTVKLLTRQSPLSVACAVEMIHRIRGAKGIEPALDLEFRFVWRSAEQGDFIEGIRAAVIDKDRKPRWRHDGIGDVSAEDVAAMLAPLTGNALKL